MTPKGITDDQIMDAFAQAGTCRGAAELLGVNERTLRRRKASLPMRERAKSTLYGPDGEVKLQWVKAERSEREEYFLAMQDAFLADLPKAKRTKPPKLKAPDLANCYIVTDYHLGMLSWKEETGADYDLKIAEQLLIDWFALAIQRAPTASSAVLAQLGDFMHVDGFIPQTPTANHVLDADTRFPKLVDSATRLLRSIISMMLEKYTAVEVKIVEGNHDPASAVWMRRWLQCSFEYEPRVHVDMRPDPYYCYEHGLTSVFFHHGHKRKPQNIHDVFVAKFREVFGRTKYSYAHMGHMHHVESKETNLMLVEQHRTLAAPDAYASRGGWLSGRSANVITYSKQWGEVGRLSITPEMVR